MLSRTRKRLPSAAAAAVLILTTPSMTWTFWSSSPLCTAPIQFQHGATTSTESTIYSTIKVLPSQQPQKKNGYLELLIRRGESSPPTKEREEDAASTAHDVSWKERRKGRLKKGRQTTSWKQEIQKSKFMYVNTSHPFFICMSPKTGCTSLHSFFMYPNFGILLDGEIPKREIGFLFDTHSEKILSMYAGRFDSEVFASHDKIVIARNPYVRFLSSYQDWMRRRVKARDHDGKKTSFQEFARMYQNKTSKGKCSLKH